MALGTLDWFIVGIFFTIVLSIGWAASKTAGESSSQFWITRNVSSAISFVIPSDSTFLSSAKLVAASLADRSFEKVSKMSSMVLENLAASSSLLA